MLFSSALSRTKWVAKGLVHERMCSNVRFPFDVILLSLADPLVEVRRRDPSRSAQRRACRRETDAQHTSMQFSSSARFCRFIVFSVMANIYTERDARPMLFFICHGHVFSGALQLSLGNRRRFVDLINDMLNGVSMQCSRFATVCKNCADLFNGFTRTEIRCPDQKNNMIHESKSVVQHESLHLSVVISTPTRAGKECPADLKFPPRRSIPEVP